MATKDTNAESAAAAQQDKNVVPQINVSPQIDDDPAQVDKAVERLRKCFNTGKTKSYTYRVG